MTANTKEPPPKRRHKYFDWDQIKWMASLSLHHPWRCALLLALNLSMLALMVGGLSLTGTVIDEIRALVDPKAPLPVWPFGLPRQAHWDPQRILIVLGAGIVLVAAVRAVLRMSADLTKGALIQTILSDLRANVYRKLTRLSFRFYDSNESGSIINRGTGDVAGVAQFAEFAVIQITVLVVTLTVFFLYMLTIHTYLALVALCTTPLLAVASITYSRIVRPAYERNRQLYDKVIIAVSENIQGKHVVKGFALEEQQKQHFREANDAYRAQQRWIFRRSSAYTMTIHLLMQTNVAIVLVVGGYLIIQSRDALVPALTVGNLVIFLALLNRFSHEVAAVANVANTLQQSLTAAGRVREVLRAPLEIDDIPQPRRLPRARGEVAFEDVTFGYAPTAPVLERLSFHALPGQCVAILGATGSGKSTLLSLIPRFYDPQKGRVLIDGIDARELRIEDLRRNIGIVFQESFLFSNTVAANISYGNPEASREQIINAAQIAQAHDFIMELPNGYDTVIGEQGNTLSGGQRQRLAIARAILLEPPILLLDDATAAIDPETEHEIMQAMDAAMKGRTTFVVAHRLSTLRRADVVLVLEGGRIIQRGSHDELVRRDGHYATIARMQVADEESLYILQAARWLRGEVDSPLLLDREDPL